MGARETTTTETDTAETTATVTATEIGTTTVAVVEEAGVEETTGIGTVDDTDPDPGTSMTVTATVTAGARVPQFATETDTIDATIGPKMEVEAGMRILETLAEIEVIPIGMG